MMPAITKQSPVNKKPRRSNPDESIVDSIGSLDDLPETGLKFLIYGLSGSGKTTLACDFPKPLLLIRPEQVEDGSLSVRKVKGIDTPRQLRSTDEFVELCNYQAETNHYKTVVLDGVGKLQDLYTKKVLNLREIPEQLSWGIATQQDWGVISGELKEGLRKLLALALLGTHVVVVGGERELDTKENASALLAPTIMVGLTPSSMGWMHEVCDYNVRTFIRKKLTIPVSIVNKKEIKGDPKWDGESYEYGAMTGPHDLYQTKFRVPKGTLLPNSIIDPTFAKMERLISGAV